MRLVYALLAVLLLPSLLQKLNPDAAFDRAGEKILVPNVQVPSPGPAALGRVSKSDRSVVALDADRKIFSSYPATIGSEHDPLPLGKWKILGVSRNPPFCYNPALFWDAKSTDEKACIAPGPNNPVGVAWIDPSKEHTGSTARLSRHRSARRNRTGASD